MIKEQDIKSTALIDKNWRKAQREDHGISFLLDHLNEGHKPSSSEEDACKIDKIMFAEWTKYHL